MMTAIQRSARVLLLAAAAMFSTAGTNTALAQHGHGGGHGGGGHGGGGYHGGAYHGGGGNWGSGYYGGRGYYGGFYPFLVLLGYGYAPWGYSGYYGYPYYSSYYDYPYYSAPVYPEVAPAEVVPQYTTAPAVTDNTAHIEIRVPDANADVRIDGMATTTKGTVREFQSPALQPGRYKYRVQATWNENGNMVTKNEMVSVTPGSNSIVTFTPNQQQ
jgi:uncharacterized protein (TIGR03000 family)